MPEAFKAESLLYALAGMRLALSAVLFSVALHCAVAHGPASWCCSSGSCTLRSSGLWRPGALQDRYLMDLAFVDVVGLLTGLVMPLAWARCYASRRAFWLMLLADLLVVGWLLVVGASITEL